MLLVAVPAAAAALSRRPGCTPGAPGCAGWLWALEALALLGPALLPLAIRMLSWHYWIERRERIA